MFRHKLTRLDIFLMNGLENRCEVIMREITITEQEAGQRFDKFLAKYMNQAPKSFFYKMLRKKNITLNGKKRLYCFFHL